MKIIPFIILLVFSIQNIDAQSEKEDKNPLGKWKFEAPYAPEGYTKGMIEVSLNENKYTASISFSGLDYKFPGEKVKVEGENLSFVVYIQDSDVSINLKMDSNTKMAGKAVYSEGEIPLSLTRDMPTQ
jgi:hypothetical protein